MRLYPRVSLWTRPSPVIARLPLSIRYQSSSSSDSPDDRPPFAPRRKRASRRLSQPLESRQVQLEIESLGQPGSVTVISPNRTKSPPRNRKPRPAQKFKPGTKATAAANPEGTPQTVIDSLLDDLDEEISDIGDHEVHEAIESLDPSSGHGSKIEPREWESLRSAIATSFTYKQLSEYLASRKESAPEKGNKEGSWRPGTSSFWNASPVEDSNNTSATPTRVATAQGLTGKPLLAEQILRDCWNMSIDDEVGQLDLRLAPGSIAVLLNSRSFSFDEISFVHCASIDVTSSLGLLRITGERETCEWIEGIILDAVLRIREIDAGVMLEDSQNTINPTQVFTKPFIEWVSQTFSVAIEQDSSSVPRKILYLAEDFRDLEDARRILNQALLAARQPPIPFSTYMPASEPANLYSQILQHPSWLDKPRSWLRWAISSAQTTSTETQRTPFFDGHQTRLSDELLKLLRKDSVEVKGEFSNSATVYESVTAAVGRCLFSPKQSSATSDAAISASQLGRSAMTRTFTTEVPNLTPFLESLSQPKSKSGTSCLRLTPSAAFGGVAPELEVEYIAHHSESGEGTEPSVEITSLKSILETSNVDYLLPENSIDLRFTRTVHRKITSEILGESPHYRQLVRNIEQALLRDISYAFSVGNQLWPAPLPPFCKISLPRGLLLSPEEETFSESIWDPLLQNNLEVEYMYPSLHDVRQAAVQYHDMDGRELSYRFYESGPYLAGRTTEVALTVDIPQLDADRHPDADGFQQAVEHHYHEFYTAACDMAFKVKSADRAAAEEESSDS